MTTSEFKKVARLLKEAYKELEAEALKDGVDIFGEEYQQIQSVIRERVLTRLGFTIEEYREAKELVAPARRVDVEQRLSEASKLTQEASERIDALEIPDEEEILAKAKEIAEAVVKPPVIQNNIVERTTVEKPTIVHTTVKETVNEEYDDNPLYAEIGYLNDRLNNIQIPEIPDIDAKIDELKEEMKNDFMRELEHNIDTLGMPDFRKLAMGLQAQIDEVRTNGGGGGGGAAVTVMLQSPDLTYWVIGITNNGELTATESLVPVVSVGSVIIESSDSTLWILGITNNGELTATPV